MERKEIKKPNMMEMPVQIASKHISRILQKNVMIEKGDDNLCQKIKEFRKEKQLSQVELSKVSGVSRSIISGLESGTIKTTTTDTLFKIASALDKEVCDIIFSGRNVKNNLSEISSDDLIEEVKRRGYKVYKEV